MTNKHRIRVALLVFLVTMLACVQETPHSETIPNTLMHAGIERTYLLHVPASYDRRHAVALVLSFHGGGGNANNQIQTSGFNTLADEKGFLVAYPNGTGRQEDKLLTWNGGACCGYAVASQVDDVGFVRALVADVQSKYDIDPKRIYATGMSNGAMLSYRLACEASDLFAAVAPVAGTLNDPGCNPSQPVSIIHFHGTQDTHVPYNGGTGPDSLVDVSFASVKDTIDFWLNADQCERELRSESFEEFQHDTYSDCADGTAVELYTIIGGKHAWPGANTPARPAGDEPTQSISATKVIWDFFTAHPRP